jgi:hypothetical protein
MSWLLLQIFMDIVFATPVGMFGLKKNIHMWAPIQIQGSDTDSYLCKRVQFLADSGLKHST